MNAIDTARPQFRASPVEDDASLGAPSATNSLVRGIDLTRIWRILIKRRWLLLGVVVAALLAGLILTLLATPLYTARTTLEIQRESRNFTNVEGVDRQLAMDQEFYQTQYGLLQSQSLAERVANDLKLQNDPNFFAIFKSRAATEWFANGRPTRKAPSNEERLRIVGSMLLGQVKVDGQRASRLTRIDYTSPDPLLSQRVANSWAKSFVEATLDRRYETTSYARQFLESRLAQLRSRIEESQKQLVSYAGAQGIVYLDSDTSANGAGQAQQPLAATTLAALNGELGKATAERIAAQSRLGSRAGEVAEALDNAPISALRERRAVTASDYAKMIAQYEPGYPPAIALQNQIKQIDRDLAREENRVRGSLQETYRAAVAREQALTTRVEQLKTSLIDLRSRTIQYDILEREVDTNKQLYAALLQRYKEIGVAGGVGVNNISVVDPAELPKGPSSPRLMLNLAIALMLGLAAGAALVFVLEQLDEAIADPAEVPIALGVPLLGTIPKIESGGGNFIEVLQDPKEPISEAYISLQTALRFSTDHGYPRSLVVTSSRQSEGKSSTSYALAKLLAQRDRKVLLIDADMRSPSLHTLLNANSAAGLSNYLAGSDDLSGLTQPTANEGLFLLAAGPQPPSAAELLASDRLGQLVARATEMFDHVIFDAPPVMGMADAPLIGSRVEGTVFVIKAHATAKGSARVAISRMLAADTVIFGAVLTQFDTQRAHYGYGYDYGYGYGYGSTAKGEA